MKTIELSQGRVATVDDEDYAELNKRKWHYANGYAVRNGYANNARKLIYMHHAVVGNPPKGKVTDHADGNGLNNTRQNLRFATYSQNQCNKGKNKHNTSGYKGVFKSSCKRPWQAILWVNGKGKYLGLYETAEEAHIAYTKASLDYHGEFANNGQQTLDK